MTRTVGNLPSEISTFVGRRRELVLGKELFASARLLTVTGTGGIGKTRLALRVAADTSRSFPDGTWLVELAEVKHGEFVASKIAATLGLQNQTVDPMTRLAEHLSDKTLLLLLDNCEHLVEACADVVAELLSAAPHIRVLATSRRVLGVPGEQVYPVPPMSFSPVRNSPVSGQCDADSVTLFVDRGHAANPHFTLSSDNSATISKICSQLEGVPLAIELAAVRLRTLSEDQILARLDDALDLLVSGPRSTPERQQRIEATIDWSYRLCTPAERRLWRALSVYAGGVTLDALETLSTEAGIPWQTLLEALDGLVEKSIVNRVDSDGQVRFYLLEVLRQFGHRQIQAKGELDDVHVRHLGYFERLAARGPTDYCSPEDYSWMDEVRREHANLRVALEYALTTSGLASRAMKTAADLKPFWTHTGFLHEGHEWLRRAIAVEPDVTTPELLYALSALADLGLLLAQIPPSLDQLARCQRLASELPGDQLTPRLRTHIAFVETLAAFFTQGPAQCLQTGEIGARLALETEAEDPGETAQALSMVAISAFLVGDPRAEDLARDFLEMTERHGARLMRAVALWVLGMCRWRAGDVTTAEEHLSEALEVHAQFDSLGLVASATEGLGWSAAAATDYERAAVLFGFVDRIREAAKLAITQHITDIIGTEVRADVQLHLGGERWREALERGGSLSRADGIDLARRVKSSPAASSIAAASGERRGASTGSLTKREAEVAELVAEGLSNKEIAERLVISVRTAETHVEKVLIKLNFNSRSQIAAWLNAQPAQAR